MINKKKLYIKKEHIEKQYINQKYKQINKIKKNIARIITIINSKNINIIKNDISKNNKI